MAHHHGFRDLFKCPECGYKNYVTEEDITRRKAKLLEQRDNSKLFGENIKEMIRNIKNMLPPKPPKEE